MSELSRALPVSQAMLFGSWAKGAATAFSGIDLLVIYGGPSREDAYMIARREVPMRGLEPHVYNEDEAAQFGPDDRKTAFEGVSIYP